MDTMESSICPLPWISILPFQCLNVLYMKRHGLYIFVRASTMPWQPSIKTESSSKKNDTQISCWKLKWKRRQIGNIVLGNWLALLRFARHSCEHHALQFRFFPIINWKNPFFSVSWREEGPGARPSRVCYSAKIIVVRKHCLSTHCELFYSDVNIHTHTDAHIHTHTHKNTHTCT